MIVESLFEVAREKAHLGCVLLQVVFTNVFFTCLICKGVHGECARMRANFLGSYTTDICRYPRALMPWISVLYPVAYTTDISLRSRSVVCATGYDTDVRGIGTNTV